MSEQFPVRNSPSWLDGRRPEMPQTPPPQPIPAEAADARQLAAGSLTIGQIHAQHVAITVNNTTIREETRVVQTVVEQRYQSPPVVSPSPSPVRSRRHRSSLGDVVATGLGCLAVALLVIAAAAFLVGWGWHALTVSGDAAPAPITIEIRPPIQPPPPPRTFDEFLKQYERDRPSDRE